MFKKSTLILALVSALSIVPVAQAATAVPLNNDGSPVMSIASMLEQVTPSIVNIAVKGTRTSTQASPFNDPFFEKFFGQVPQQQQQERPVQGAGSGVIIDADKGFIITNAHVIADADEIMVRLKDGRQFEATLVGKDPDADVAVVQIEADGLKEIRIADSDAVNVGDFVSAIGNPFGLEQSVTFGIVSALGRNGLGIESYEDFIQTDASINPGNSGGALVNMQGELVGINTAILGAAGNIGIGFAIPINMATAITSQLVEFGEVKRGRLGVGIQDLTPELAKQFDLDNTRGALVSQVEVDSPADRAGIQAGDVITKVNGADVKDSSALRNKIGLMRSDSKLNIELIRDGKVEKIKAQIEQIAARESRGKSINKRLDGAAFVESDDVDNPGVVVASIEPGSNAARSGLVEGDIIISANREPVGDINSLKKAVSENKDSVLLNIVRQGRGLFILIQ